MTGHCFVCNGEADYFHEVCTFRGNCKHFVSMCDRCYNIRCRAGSGLCANCRYSEAVDGSTKWKWGCSRYHRYIDLADCCGSWEERPDRLGRCPYCGMLMLNGIHPVPMCREWLGRDGQ